MEMFVVGLVLGLIVLFVEPRRPARIRRRSMSDAQAVGFRAALGEDPVTMRTRNDESTR